MPSPFLSNLVERAKAPTPPERIVPALVWMLHHGYTDVLFEEQFVVPNIVVFVSLQPHRADEVVYGLTQAGLVPVGMEFMTLDDFAVECMRQGRREALASLEAS